MGCDMVQLHRGERQGHAQAERAELRLHQALKGVQEQNRDTCKAPGSEGAGGSGRRSQGLGPKPAGRVGLCWDSERAT